MDASHHEHRALGPSHGALWAEETGLGAASCDIPAGVQPLHSFVCPMRGRHVSEDPGRSGGRRRCASGRGGGGGGGAAATLGGGGGSLPPGSPIGGPINRG